MNVQIEQSWREALSSEWEAPYFQTLVSSVKDAYRRGPVWPAPGRIFAAFDACPLPDVKVVILGQDPYHGPGQANGLCFSVADGVPVPPSLENIFKEVASDMGRPDAIPSTGNLERWARQGVLLLNATLTVEQHHAGSHQGLGWEIFTDAVVRTLNERRSGLVFMLWGTPARRKGALVNRSRHYVLESPHPSPFSAYRGFFGNHHFSKANAYLQAQGLTPINWLP